MPKNDPLTLMVADTLLKSDAPRFLLALFTLPPGEHRIALPRIDGISDSSEIWAMISEGEDSRRARVSLPYQFDNENAVGLGFETVWQHIVVSDDVIREAKTMEETLPAVFEIECALSDFAANDIAVEDFCDACALPRDPNVRGVAASEPLESHPPYTQPALSELPAPPTALH